MGSIPRPGGNSNLGRGGGRMRPTPRPPAALAATAEQFLIAGAEGAAAIAICPGGGVQPISRLPAALAATVVQFCALNSAPTSAPIRVVEACGGYGIDWVC